MTNIAFRQERGTIRRCRAEDHLTTDGLFCRLSLSCEARTSVMEVIDEAVEEIKRSWCSGRPLRPHLARPETRLIAVAMITATSGNDIKACRRAVRRICLDLMLVSETWNVMPIVKAR